MLTYSAAIKPVHEGDDSLLVDLLERYREVVNAASKLKFEGKLMGLTELHNAFYYQARERFPDVPSQVIIKAEQESVACYRSMKSNKKVPKKPFEKKGLSLRLDKRISSRTKVPTRINVITTEKRKEFDIVMYPRLQEMMSKYDYQDPLVFVWNGKLMLSLTFDVKTPKQEPTLCLGVDLGIRRVAACSDGRLIIDKEFNKEKRKLRYLKCQLQSKGTKSTRKHLRKLKRKERNMNRNQTHLVANAILKSDANCIALENLTGIKAKKHKWQNKRAISQLPLFEWRRIWTYKAMHRGMSVCLVSPAYTSQTDSQSGKREGERRGVRFYAKGGKVYDADINAAINIALRSKLPISLGGFAAPLDGQGVVNRPIARKSSAKAGALQAHGSLAHG